jgi:glycosyltransferase involved in cell wall biosynthesis
MDQPLISCIVPVFNGQPYLTEALESIFQQTYRPIEVIVADDGSKDETAAVAASYGDRIRYVRQDNAGAPAARNLGMSIARGEFIAFLDADDLWHPEKLNRQIASFAACPEIDLSITHIQNFWIPELKEEAERYRNHRLGQAVPGYVAATLLARRSLFNRVGPFNSVLRHGDAQEWFLRAAERGVVIELLPDVLVYRRFHKANTSRNVSSALDEHLRILKMSLDRRRQQDPTPSHYEFPGTHPIDRKKS